MNSRLAGLVAALLLSAPLALAHETWMLAGSSRLAAPGTLTLGVSSGMAFPKPDTALSPDRLSLSGVRIGTTRVPLESVGALGGAAFLRATLRQTGYATAWLELSPIPIELSDPLVAVYLDEIDAAAPLREFRLRQEAANPPLVWRERYAKFAKTIIRVGAPAEDRSWAEPIGGPIEIVPEIDPTGLVRGAAFSVRVLKHGRPLVDLPLALMEGGQRAWQRTDADGRARFTLATAGRWLVHGTELLPPATLDGEWESWFATLTIAAER